MSCHGDMELLKIKMDNCWTFTNEDDCKLVGEMFKPRRFRD
jgi:hypothetical protein